MKLSAYVSVVFVLKYVFLHSTPFSMRLSSTMLRPGMDAKFPWNIIKASVRFLKLDSYAFLYFKKIRKKQLSLKIAKVFLID